MFLIYADKKNEPADYSKDNQPLKPLKSVSISLKGVKANDFTMVFGYPGTTNEYLTSHAIKQIVEIENPEKIEIRTKKLDIINNSMNSSELLRIKYSAKAAGVANSWKRWIGEIKGLNRFNTIEEKQNLENRFTEWVSKKNKRIEKYGDVLSEMAKLYAEKEKYAYAYSYATEAGLRGAEIISFANTINYALKDEKTDKTKVIAFANQFFKDFDYETDKRIFAELFSLYINKTADEFLPEEFKVLRGSDINKFANDIYTESKFTKLESTIDFINNYNKEQQAQLENDAVVKIANSILVNYRKNIAPKYFDIDDKVAELQKTWLAGLMEMESNKTFYPDANSTFRVAYGHVKGYSPRDAVSFNHYTTLEGIMEKDNPNIYDYDVPAKLKELYKNKDYGRYTQDGKIPVCFVANNHTTGGNSGSPVLNGNGELIGLNFDRAWEGVMSDMKYDPEICRNIALDIRYVLFIVDKYAGATHLIEEINIIE